MTFRYISVGGPFKFEAIGHISKWFVILSIHSLSDLRIHVVGLHIQRVSTQTRNVPTRVWRPLWYSYVLSSSCYHPQTNVCAWDRINFSDFGVEIVASIKFYVDYFRGKPSTRSRLMDGDEAFGPWYKMEERGGEGGSLVHLRSSEL